MQSNQYRDSDPQQRSRSSRWLIRCLLVFVPWSGAFGNAQVELLASDERCLEQPDYTCLVNLAERFTLSRVEGFQRANGLVQLVALYGQAGDISRALDVFGSLSDEEHIYWALPELVAAMLRAGRDAEAGALATSFPSHSRTAEKLLQEERGRLAASVLGTERAVGLASGSTSEGRDAFLRGILSVAQSDGDLAGTLAVATAGFGVGPSLIGWLVSGFLSDGDVAGALIAASLAGSGSEARHEAEVAIWLGLNGRIQEAIELLGPPASDDNLQRWAEDSIIRGLLSKNDEVGASVFTARRSDWTRADIQLELATARLVTGDVAGATRLLEGDFFDAQGLSGVAERTAPIRMLTAGGREDLAQVILGTIESERARAEAEIEIAVGHALANEDAVLGAIKLLDAFDANPGVRLFGIHTSVMGELVSGGRSTTATFVAQYFDDSDTYGTLVTQLLENGEFERALSVVDRFDVSQHNFPVTTGRIAAAMARSGDLEGAVLLAERDVFSDPFESTGALMDIAARQMEDGNEPDARATITRALQMAAGLGDDFALLRRALEAAAILNGFSLVSIMYGM